MAEPTLSKKRYVPMTEASRISGYTDEYIGRLCRIGKIPCRVMGEKMIVELDALLAQTGTILLGGEHVGFIEVDDEARYPLVPSAGAEETPEIEEIPEEGPHIGSIAVVGETVESENDSHSQGSTREDNGQTEKFPSNALPFFSSVAQKRSVAGVHVRVAAGEAGVWERPVSHRPVKLAVHTENEAPIIAEVPLSPTVASSPILSEIPAGTPAVPAAVEPVVVPSPVSVENYVSTLPMVISPVSLPGKALLSVLALGLFVAPTTLGIGDVLNTAVLDLNHALRMSARATLAAVGLSSADDPGRTFPFLTETSLLLSAVAASGGAGGGNGVVVTPLSGSSATDEQVRSVVQATFSDPITITPDGKDGRTGMIRPTFTKNGTGYMYMLVPVRQ